jgi:hypothetical protein
MADGPFNLGAVLSGLPGAILPQNDEREKLKAEQAEIDALAEQEKLVLKQMGIDPSARRDQKIKDEWGAKGKWGKLGMILSEGLRGAAMGSQNVPYSERKYQEALRDDAAQRPYLKEQLEGINRQKVTREANKAKIQASLDKLAGQYDYNNMRREDIARKTNEFSTLAPGKIAKTQAETDLLGSRSSLVNQQTEGISIDNVNKTNTGGRTGQAAADWLNSAKDIDPERIKRLQGLVKGRQRPAAPKSGGDNSRLVEAVLQNPLIYDSLTGKVRNEIAAPLQEKGFGYFGKAPSDGAIKEVAASKSSLSSLNDLKDTLTNNKQYLGVLRGWQGYIPGSPAQLARAEIDLVRQRVGKALEGGVLRKEDESKYKAILSKLLDEPEIAIGKTEQLIENISKDMAIFEAEQKRGGRKSLDPAKPGVPSKASAGGDISLDAVRAEVARRKAMKASGVKQ